MKDENQIIFLGTGGGRSIMFSQARRTGGIFIELDKTRLLIDPGPGSLTTAKELGLSLRGLDALLVSHIHPDHSTDANAVIDGHADDENFILIAEKHVVNPTKETYPVISRYHQGLCKKYAVGPGEKIKVKNLTITTTPARHSAPAVGFRIAGTKIISYPCDGSYFRGQEKYYDSSDILILNVLAPFPNDKKMAKHMDVEDAIKLINAMKDKPKLVIIQHFSFYMLRADVRKQAKIIEKKTGIKCIPARDGMKLDVDSLGVEKKGLEKFIG